MRVGSGLDVGKGDLLGGDGDGKGSGDGCAQGEAGKEEEEGEGFGGQVHHGCGGLSVSHGSLQVEGWLCDVAQGSDCWYSLVALYIRLNLEVLAVLIDSQGPSSFTDL